MLVILSELLGILYVLSIHDLSLLTGLDRTLEYFYVMLSLLSLGLTMGIG
jgi:hypothetical protein